MKVRQITVATLAWTLYMASAGISDTRIVMHEGTALERADADMPESVRESFAEQEPSTVTYWITDDKAARLDDSGMAIARVDRGKSYFVNRQEKTYTAIELSADQPQSSTADAWEIVESGETRQIGPWSAVRHDMTIDTDDDPIDVTLWVADIGIDMDAYHAFIEAVAEAQVNDWMNAYLELDGYPVRQEVRLGGILSWQEVVSVSEEPAPAGTYDVPEGYSEEE